jgi:hypothetical protein
MIQKPIYFAADPTESGSRRLQLWWISLKIEACVVVFFKPLAAAGVSLKIPPGTALTSFFFRLNDRKRRFE